MAGTRGRPPGFVMSPEHRTKIQNSQVLNCLLEHVCGNRDMSSTQVTAGIALMKKVLPDLSATDVTGTINHEHDLADQTREAILEFTSRLARVTARRGTGETPE
jgi:hypothetical protein